MTVDSQKKRLAEIEGAGTSLPGRHSALDAGTQTELSLPETKHRPSCLCSLFPAQDEAAGAKAQARAEKESGF